MRALIASIIFSLPTITEATPYYMYFPPEKRGYIKRPSLFQGRVPPVTPCPFERVYSIYAIINNQWVRITENNINTCGDILLQLKNEGVRRSYCLRTDIHSAYMLTGETTRVWINERCFK